MRVKALDMLTTEDRSSLLTIAREAIRAALLRQPFDPGDRHISEALLRPAGAFVTLETDGELRGCIGSIAATEPLYLAVARNAVSAAFRDPRFFPVTALEAEGLAIEISVMGPIERVSNWETIVIGRDGLIVRQGGRTGLLLPQVAVEWGWDRDAFLSQTCVKAGLDPRCWQDSSCLVEKFSAEVFS